MSISGWLQAGTNRDLLMQQLDAFEDQIKFAQGFSGMRMDAPFKEIQKTREMINKRMRASTEIIDTLANIGVTTVGSAFGAGVVGLGGLGLTALKSATKKRNGG